MRDEQARLDETNARLRDLQKAAKGLTQLQRLKAAADETCTRLRTEVLGIKQQKVALARQIERSQRDFAEHRWRHRTPTAPWWKNACMACARPAMCGCMNAAGQRLRRGTPRLDHG